MLVIALGVWVVIIPYLGVPGSWRTVLLIGTGILLIIIGLFLRTDSLGRGTRRGVHHSFVENGFASTAHGEHHHHEHKGGIGSLN